MKMKKSLLSKQSEEFDQVLQRYIRWYILKFNEIPNLYEVTRSKYLGHRAHIKNIIYLYNVFHHKSRTMFEYLEFVYAAWLNKEDAQTKHFPAWLVSPKLIEQFFDSKKKKYLIARHGNQTNAGKETYSDHDIVEDHDANHQALF